MNSINNKYLIFVFLFLIFNKLNAQIVSTYYGFNSNVYNPYGLSTNSNGDFSYVTQSGWPPLINKINSGGVVSTQLSGNYYPLYNYMSYYSDPIIMDYDNMGNLYFIDDYNWPRSIQKVEPNGTVSAFVSNNNYYPSSITCDNSGNLYFLDDMNYGTINKVDQFGTITTIVNNSNYYIKSITCDNSGNLYFIDDYNYGTIQKVDQYGTVSLFINNSNYYFKSITCDNSGNLYFIDQYTYPRNIQKVDPSGIISPYITNSLYDPKNLIADNNGNLFFIDYNGHYNIMTVTNPNNNCIAPSSPSSSDISVCGGNTAILTANGIGEMNWYDAASGGNLLNIGNEFNTPTINNDVTYYVEGYYCNLSSNRTPVNVTKLETPVAVITGNATGNDFVNLTASGNGNYLWSGGYSPTQAINYFTNSGSYTLTVTNVNGCANSTNVSVTINKFGVSKFGGLTTDTTYKLNRNGIINSAKYINKHGKEVLSKTDGNLNYKVYTSSASYANNANDFLNFTNISNQTSTGSYSGNLLLDWTNAGMLTNSNISIPNNGERFTFQVTGYFVPEESGIYTFTCEGDDAVDLFINGVNVANHYGAHGTGGLGSHTGTIDLVANTKYTFRARMQENGGGEGLRVFWRKPSESSGWFINTAELSSY